MYWIVKTGGSATGGRRGNYGAGPPKHRSPAAGEDDIDWAAPYTQEAILVASVYISLLTVHETRSRCRTTYVDAHTPDMTTNGPRGLIVGAGAMGLNHLRVLHALPGVEPWAVVDTAPERRERARRLYPQLMSFASLDQALERVAPDFACVAVPVGKLPELAIRLILEGIPTLVEKPLAPTLEEGLSVVREAELRGVLLAVGLIERCNPAVTALRQRLESGAIGEIVQLHARRLSPPPGRDATPSVALDLASHDIDVMRFLTGGDVERVFAETACVAHGPISDLLCATLRFDTNPIGLLDVNWLTPTKVRQISVTGESGMFVVDYLTQGLRYHQHVQSHTEWDALAGLRGAGQGDVIEYGLERREPLSVEWENFLAAMNGESAPYATGEDALAVLATIEAIHTSAEVHEGLGPRPLAS